MSLALKLAATRTAKPAKSTTPEVPHLEADAARYRELTLEADAIAAELKSLKSSIIEATTEARGLMLRAGSAPKSLSVPDGEGHRVLVSYTDRFRPLGEDCIPDLRGAFGESYTLACVEVEVCKIKAVSTDRLIDVIGIEAVCALESAGLAESTTTVAPRKGCAGTVAEWYAAGESELASNLEEFVSATAYAPTVRVK